MKILLTVVVAFGFMVSIFTAEAQGELKNEAEKLSYSMGYDLGKKLKEESIEIAPDILSKGVRDGFNGSQPLMTTDEIKASLKAFQQELIAKETERRKLIGEKSKKDGEAFSTHYRGTLVDGTEFDSSYKRGKPAVFPVQGVIPGWTEALQLMKEGAHWQLFIPSQLAYGERGIGNVIGPNATLIFEIELLSVQDKQ
jgi:FKBP-type peptidyl-prolyl cis-trans isomerase FklB